MPSDVFLKVDGLEGESNDEQFKNQIEVLSFSWGVTQSITGTVSSAGTFTGQRADHAPLTIQKYFDKASPKASQSCAAGDHFKSAVLTLCRAGGKKQPYMEYKLDDVLLGSVQVGGAGEGGVPTESWTLYYSKITQTYTQIGLDGNPLGAGAAVGWDLKQNKKA